MLSLRVLCVVVTLGTAALGLVGCGDAADTSEGQGGRFDDVTSVPPKRSAAPNDGGATATADAPTSEGTGTEPPLPPKAGDPRTCATPRDLGAIAGDLGAPSISTHGTCSEWIRIRVTEDDSGVVGARQKVTATLVSPDQDDFDLELYVNTEADAVECSTAKAKSELPAGRSDVVKATWGETMGFGNNSDDGRTVNIHVTKKTGTCSTQPWALLIQGNY